MKLTCPTCDARYNCDRDEDGAPELPGQRCADPTCPAWLCPNCLEHHSFHCDGCGERFCSDHAVQIPDGTPRPLKCCVACAAVLALEEPEPVCTCQQTDVDLFDARGCELHYDMSAYNCRMRAAGSAVQQYAEAMGGVA
jgi:hypothetical protein